MQVLRLIESLSVLALYFGRKGSGSDYEIEVVSQSPNSRGTLWNNLKNPPLEILSVSQAHLDIVLKMRKFIVQQESLEQ